MGGRDDLMDQHHVMTTNSEEGQRERGHGCIAFLPFNVWTASGTGQDRTGMMG